MSAFSGLVLAILALAVLWLVIGVALAFVAARRLRMADAVLGAAKSNAALLEISPARPMLVRPDSQIEVDSALLRELGLKGQPKVLSDLTRKGSGFAPEDLEALTADVQAARASAGTITRKVRVNGSARVFEVRGQPAPGSEPPGSI